MVCSLNGKDKATNKCKPIVIKRLHGKMRYCTHVVEIIRGILLSSRSLLFISNILVAKRVTIEKRHNSLHVT
jgi:hypothetical protein